MRNKEHLDEVFPSEHHSELRTAITRVSQETDIQFGRLVNKLIPIFPEIKPYLDAKKYSYGKAGRCAIIEAALKEDIVELERLKIDAAKHLK